jgi:hypothetical protein
MMTATQPREVLRLIAALLGHGETRSAAA